jgi:hypothetical protein
MDPREQNRKEKQARRKVADRLGQYYSSLLREDDPDVLIDIVKQMLLEKEMQNRFHV